MPETKTRVSDESVAKFIDAVENPGRRDDARILCDLMQRVTGQEPRMWGPSIVGFGSYDYRYDSGHGGTMCRVGFSPRKAQLVLYVLTARDGEAELLKRLGKHKAGKGCLYINKLADVDAAVLRDLVSGCWDWMDSRYPN